MSRMKIVFALPKTEMYVTRTVEVWAYGETPQAAIGRAVVEVETRYPGAKLQSAVEAYRGEMDPIVLPVAVA